MKLFFIAVLVIGCGSHTGGDAAVSNNQSYTGCDFLKTIDMPGQSQFLYHYDYVSGNCIDLPDVIIDYSMPANSVSCDYGTESDTPIDNKTCKVQTNHSDCHYSDGIVSEKETIEWVDRNGSGILFASVTDNENNFICSATYNVTITNL